MILCNPFCKVSVMFLMYISHKRKLSEYWGSFFYMGYPLYIEVCDVEP